MSDSIVADLFQEKAVWMIVTLPDFYTLQAFSFPAFIGFPFSPCLGVVADSDGQTAWENGGKVEARLIL